MNKPLNCPHPGSKAFEVIIYNREVRANLKDNIEHNAYDERWANPTRQEVQASDADEARRLAASHYPEEKGFVIASVTAIVPPGRAL